MSKLDDMITEHYKSCFGEISVWKDYEFKKQIKDLMLELIGTPDDYDSNAELTEYKYEIRQKVQDL